MAKRIAFLVGNQVFRPDSGLMTLRGPHNDVAAMSRLLGDPGREQFSVREFLDKPRHEIMPDIEEALSSAAPGDLVLIYYSGHGKLDRRGHVCLATADTRAGALHATSIPARHLTDLVSQSDCDQVVLMLDCCYSGAIDDGTRGDVASEMQIVEDARGFFILTASTETQGAREVEGSPGATVMGRFTAALVGGIETGRADVHRKGRIFLSDLRAHVEGAVAGQTPRFFARRATGDPLISLSPETALPLLDMVIVADLAAESWHHRLGAVSYLVDEMRSGGAKHEAVRALLEGRLPLERDIDVRKRIVDALNVSPEAKIEPLVQPEPPREASDEALPNRREKVGALAKRWDWVPNEIGKNSQVFQTMASELHGNGWMQPMTYRAPLLPSKIQPFRQILVNLRKKPLYTIISVVGFLISVFGFC